MDDVQDPQNIGAIYRLSDALGVTEIITQQGVGTNTKVQRIARQTHNHIETQVVNNLANYLTQQTAPCIALELTQLSQSVFDPNIYNWLSQYHKIFLVAGNEQRGLSSGVLSCCQRALHIPMQGQNSSMNVAQAIGIVAAILLFT